MTGSMKHDLFRGSSAGGSCGLVMVVVPGVVFIFALLLSCTAAVAVASPTLRFKRSLQLVVASV